MPLGDSITEAEGGWASYRYWLWRSFSEAGFDVDFVGSMSGVFDGEPTFQNFDQDHEGHWGWRADEVLREIDAWAAAARPDVVLLHLGTNDISEEQSIPSTLEELAEIVLAIRKANPRVVILLAQLIPSTDPGLERIPEFNQEIPGLAADLDTPESPVLVVNQARGFDATTDTYDGVHPDRSGEKKMSRRWLESLRQFLDQGAALLSDDFESGRLTQWSRHRKAAVDIVEPGLEGSRFALGATLGGSNAPSFVTSTLPTPMTSFQVAFLLAASGVNLENREAIFLQLRNKSKEIARLTLEQQGRRYWVNLYSTVGGGPMESLGRTRVPRKKSISLGIEWRQATEAAASNGVLRLLKRKRRRAGATTLRSGQQFATSVRLGLPLGFAGGQGTFRFDNYSSAE